eukprot:8841663-Lingulodinium_polyedra.AAC.1
MDSYNPDALFATISAHIYSISEVAHARKLHHAPLMDRWPRARIWPVVAASSVRVTVLGLH